MSKIAIGAPITTFKVNLMEYTRNIYPIKMMNGIKKNRRIEKPKKGQGTSLQGIVKKLGKLEVENDSLCPHVCSLHYTLTMECTGLK